LITIKEVALKHRLLKRQIPDDYTIIVVQLPEGQMINWLRLPQTSHVAKYIERFWFLEKKEESTSYNFPKLNPDPSAHLIIASESYSFKYDIKDPSLSGNGSHWVFPHRKTFEMDHSNAFAIIGIKFHIGALYSLDMGDVTPAINQVSQLDIDLLFRTNSVDTEGVLNLAKVHPEECYKTLENALLPWLMQSQQDTNSLLAQRVLPLLADTQISELGNQLHCSQRTLERNFLKVTGLTLKQCQSMIRLEAMLEHLYQMDIEDIDWADVAYGFGFSDQPHLIRYLKSTIGATPGEYAKLRNLTIDIYGGVETT